MESDKATNPTTPKESKSRRPIERSRSSYQVSIRSTIQAPTPTFLTSFPSFSPPKLPPNSGMTSKLRQKSNTIVDSPTANKGPSYSSLIAKNDQQSSRSVSSPEATHKHSSSTSGTGSAMNRTIRTASKLTQSLMESLTATKPSSRNANGRNATSLFSNACDAAGDPLFAMSDAEILRIIDSSGGPVKIARKYSESLTESNERTAYEKNGKKGLVEENRRLRLELDGKDEELKELQLQLTVAKQLFQKYIAQSRQDLAGTPNLQILESPSGPYAWEDHSGTLLAALRDDFVFPPDPAPVATPISTHPDQSFDPDEMPITTTNKSQDAIRAKRHSKTPLVPQRLSTIIKPETEAVEMKSPVDILQLPPVLRAERPPEEEEGLVDRLGYYVTLDREKRHQEANERKANDNSEVSSVHSDNHKDDEENIASTGELLCDAPASKLVFSSTHIFIELDKQVGNSSITSQSSISNTYAAADIASPSQALSSLRNNLNQTHDSQQRKRIVEWTALGDQIRNVLRKDAVDSAPEQYVSGIAALCSASHLSADVRTSLKHLIRRGIPVAFRREVWLERSGASNIRDPDMFAQLLREAAKAEAEEAKYEEEQDQISIDVERTLADNIFFREGVGKARLKSVLVAFAQQNPLIGYPQGLNIIAAKLLLMVPTAEDAFALITKLVRDILPSDYYSSDGSILLGVLERDGKVTESYMAEVLPQLHKHMQATGVNLTMFMTGWYITVFAAPLQGEPLYRLWDLVFGFADGRFLICFALALLKLNRKALMACRDGAGLKKYLNGRMGSVAVEVDVLVNETVRMAEKVSSADLPRRRSLVEGMMKEEEKKMREEQEQAGDIT